MSPDGSQPQTPLVIASAAATGATPRLAGGLRPLRLSLPRFGALQRARAGRIALTTIVLTTFLVVAYATASQNVLVPRAYLGFPLWESGPLHLLFHVVPVSDSAARIGLSVVLVVLLGAYGVALTALRTLSLRLIMLAVVALHLIVLLSPPLQLNDVFNYLGYARLGGLHGLSPYTHVIADEMHDPVWRFSSWHNLSSPYGPLFTVLTYPLASLSVPAAYWVIKVAEMVMSLACIALVGRCARQLGRDPRYAVVFFALNPVYVVYAMAGFHNDFFLLVPSIGAISLLLGGRDRSAGALLVLAVGVKFTAVLLLPFLVLAARTGSRRRRVVVGAAGGGAAMVALSLAVFGPHLPNLADQSTLLTDFSIPQLVGLALGFGGGVPGLLRAANVLVVLAVAWLLRRRGDWLTNAGWATLALIASLAWLMPWYVIWLLPLAGLGTSLRLRRAAIALSVFLILTFMPVTGSILVSHGFDPLNTSVGHASLKLQKQLSG